MKRHTLWRWVLFCPLLYGCLAGAMTCTQLARDAVFSSGTIQFVTGQVSNTFGTFPISDLIIGLFTGGRNP